MNSSASKSTSWFIRSEKLSGGFTLIEVLIALVLFSVGILGVVALQSQAPGFTVNAENNTRASLLAAMMESRMRALNTIDPGAAEILAWQKLVTGDTPSNLALPNSGDSTVTPHTGAAQPYAEIIVIWQDPNKSSQDEYQTRVFQ